MDSKSKIHFKKPLANDGAKLIHRIGCELLWKDWDAALTM